MSKIPDAVADPRGYMQSQGLPGAMADGGLRAHMLAHPKGRHVPIEHEGDHRDAPPGALLSVDLGGERMRAVVRLVVDPDLVVIEVTGTPFTRNHAFRQGDFVPVARRQAMLGEAWEATVRSAVDQKEIDRLAEERRKRLEREKTAAPKRRRGEK
jgi:hypothetical protein